MEAEYCTRRARRKVPMIHYSCDCCKRVLDPEDLRYVVKMEVYAAFDPSAMDELDDDRDHLQEIQEILQRSDERGRSANRQRRLRTTAVRSVHRVPQEVHQEPAGSRTAPSSSTSARTSSDCARLPSCTPACLCDLLCARCGLPAAPHAGARRGDSRRRVGRCDRRRWPSRVAHLALASRPPLGKLRPGPAGRRGRAPRGARRRWRHDHRSPRTSACG